MTRQARAPMDEPRALWDPIHTVLSPPKRVMRSLSMAWKLAIVVALFAIPLTYLMVVTWMRATGELEVARLEAQGSRLSPFVLDVAEAAHAGGAGVGAAMGRLDKALEESGDPLKVKPAAAAVRRAWDATAGATADPKARAAALAAVDEKIDALWEAVSMASGIVLDPDIDTYHAMLGFAQALPQLGADFHQLALEADRAGRSDPGVADRVRAAGHLSLVRKNLEIVKEAIGDVKNANPAMGASLEATGAWIKDAEALASETLGHLSAGTPGNAPLAGNAARLQAASAGAHAQAKRWAAAFDQGVDERAGRLNRSRWITLALSAVAAAISVYLLLGFWMAIRGGIIAMQRSLERIGAGDLASAADVEGKDEISLALHAIHDMQKSLAGTMGQVRSVSDSIGTAGGEIASGNQDLASRTEEQAASLQQTAASIHHLDEAVQRNVGNAEQASVLVAQASQVANRGGTAVQGVVETMGAIQASSRKISEIIGVIDGIAFQTNILALNAAVEAARAGEQGRGFAVVASEVRTLAQRSATAAREIKGLIEASVQDVDRGARQVRDTTGTINEVVTAVERAAQLMERIALDSREQGEGIAEVTKAVGQMDAVTQQNSALVEQTAAASESLKTQAHELVAVVARFRLQGPGFSPA